MAPEHPIKLSPGQAAAAVIPTLCTPSVITHKVSPIPASPTGVLSQIGGQQRVRSPGGAHYAPPPRGALPGHGDEPSYGRLSTWGPQIQRGVAAPGRGPWVARVMPSRLDPADGITQWLLHGHCLPVRHFFSVWPQYNLPHCIRKRPETWCRHKWCFSINHFFHGLQPKV